VHHQGRVFITDCEGPVSKNDNAFELMVRFVPEGDRIFTLLSRYDDVLVEVVRRQGYKAGGTLRLILPFLKAYGATDSLIRDCSAANIDLIEGARDTLRYVMNLMPSFIVSTSYEHYLSALCRRTGFPYSNVYCTRLGIDGYGMSRDEIARLKGIRDEIVAMPMIEIPEDAVSPDDLPGESMETIEKLDEIFMEELAGMEAGRMLSEVDPVGGDGKARAVEEITEHLGSTPGDVMYIGDSITDAPPLRLVRESGGLTVSFNGNEYAIREAEIGVVSDNTLVTSILAEVFSRQGREGGIRLAEEWSSQGVETLPAAPDLKARMAEAYPEELPVVRVISAGNVESENLKKASSAMRERLRGGSIARLG